MEKNKKEWGKEENLFNKALEGVPFVPRLFAFTIIIWVMPIILLFLAVNYILAKPISYLFSFFKKNGETED